MTLNFKPRGIFISINDDIYAAGYDRDRISVWRRGDEQPIKNIDQRLSDPMSIFVTNYSTVYVNYNGSPDRIDRWSLDSTVEEQVAPFCRNCAGVFIDEANRLYCASQASHQIYRRPLCDPTSDNEFVIGKPNAGPSADQLHNPRGIFVDHNFILYAADCGLSLIHI